MFDQPHLVTIGGLRKWRFADGRVLPLLAGGDDGDPPNDPPADPPAGDPPADPPADDGKARREAAELRRKLREVEAERDQLRASTMSDTERLEARAKAAEERAQKLTSDLQTSNLRVSVNRLAKDFGIVDPGLAVKLLDPSSVTYGDDHQPDEASVKAALKSVVEEHTILTRAGDSDGGRRTPAAGTGADAMNNLIRGQVGAPQ